MIEGTSRKIDSPYTRFRLRSTYKYRGLSLRRERSVEREVVAGFPQGNPINGDDFCFEVPDFSLAHSESLGWARLKGPDYFSFGLKHPLRLMTTLDLYLIRHGLAGQFGDYTDDQERPLTAEGQRKTHQVAQRLVALEIRVDLILTSPLMRARQTAEILQAAGLSQQLEVSEELAPGGEIQAWLTWVDCWRSAGHTSLAIVGHEPNLSQWAELLVEGTARGNWILKKAGVIGVKLPTTGEAIGNSELFWLTPPRLLL
jgi:phosphohistidine phosphatase